MLARDAFKSVAHVGLASVPIPGTTKLTRLEENIGAVAVELTPEDLREVDSSAAKITVQGARYPDDLERMTNL